LPAELPPRDGLLVEMATGGAWSDEFFQQIVHSAMDLGRKYQFDEEHARHVLLGRWRIIGCGWTV
jgi:exopolyphosphatase/guanosine-5'-triphosphate,3'-diphosphate pyrophosphatase